MSVMTIDEIQQDEMVMSVAWALKLANDAALAHGVDPAISTVTITAEPSQPTSVWRVHYGPRDYISRRGGDLLVTVDTSVGKVERVLRGQ